jgi:catechol 2,3-dioxygenase-like lactoylglutathione lyase family enzyme
MARPKIRHLAIVTRDPKKLADFYVRVFEMEVIYEGGEAYMVSDGYLTVALLKHRLTGEKTVGLNHFGFQVDDQQEIAKRIVALGLEEPQLRPPQRPYAEYRGCDPDGNQFDVSVHGFEEVETGEDRAKKATAPAV